MAAIVATPPPTDRPRLDTLSTPPVVRVGTESQSGSRTDRHHQKDGKSTTASSAETSEHSDVEHRWVLGGFVRGWTFSEAGRNGLCIMSCSGRVMVLPTATVSCKRRGCRAEKWN